MKLTIIGASAGVGLACVTRALDRGHQVTTLSRSTESLKPHANLTMLKGNATQPEDLKKAMQGADVVLVALGTGTSMKPTTLYTDAAQALIQAQQDLKLDVPFIVLTGFGAGESGQFHANFLLKMFFRFMLKDVYANKTEMEGMIAKSPLRHMFVRPGVLTNKPLTEHYRVETEYRNGMNIGSIPRADVADFMVKQAENPTYLGKNPALSGK